MFQPFVLILLQQSDVNGMANLSSVDLTALTGDAVNSWCPQSQVAHGQLKESRDFIWWEMNRLDVIL
jgi:hypothetical protein